MLKKVVLAFLWGLPNPLIRDHLSSKRYTVHDIWPAYWGIRAADMVKAAEERKITFKKYFWPIEDREQILHYSLELIKCGSTALRANGIHREMNYV